MSAVATVIAAVFAWLTYCRPPATGGDERLPSPGAAGATTGRPGSSPATGAAAATVTYLADLRPDRGQARLAELPSALSEVDGYQNSVVIACPSNQTADQISEVAYETRNRFSTLRATIRPYRDPADDVLVELQIFSDPPDRQPGVPAGGQPYVAQVRMGDERPIATAIDKAYYLRFRVVCEKPDGFVILTDASVR